MIKSVLSAALILSMATGAFAATKHPHKKQPAASQSSSQNASSAFGANASTNTRPGAYRGDNGAMLIQDRDFSAEHNNPYCGGRC
jgi:hypothetical protein